VFLHGDGKFPTYLQFFSKVFGELSDGVAGTEVRTADGILTGSDEEKALVKAMQVAFPSSSHLFCTLHCKDNVRRHMDDVGIAKDIRERVIALLFGSNGVSLSADEQTLENRVAEAMRFIRQNNLPIVEYVLQRIIPKLRSNCMLTWSNPWLGQHANWSNNNCESIIIFSSCLLIGKLPE